jgi:thiol-disulfide isomerase/thioredoxin
LITGNDTNGDQGTIGKVVPFLFSIGRATIRIPQRKDSVNRTAWLILTVVLSISFIRVTMAGDIPKEWTWDDDEKSRKAHAELEGKPMPALEVSDWVNGPVTPEDMKGKVVVLDFYATWCGPCVAAIPHNNEMMEKYKDKGVLVVGVCTSKNGQEKMEQQAKDKGIKYPIAKDPTLATQKGWRVMYYPTYAVVDRKGIVRVVGLQPEYVERVVEKLLAEGGDNAKKESSAKQ